MPGRPHEHDRLARRELRAQVGRAAHFEHDGGEQAVVAIDRGAGEREPFLGEPRAVGAARERLVVLQPVEPGLEGARRHRRTHHDLDDGGREPVDRVHGRAQLAVEPRISAPGASTDGASRASMRLTTGYPRLALAIAFTTLPAKDGCRSPKKLMARPSARRLISTCAAAAWDALGRDLAAVLVEGLKILAVDAHVLRLLAAEHGVGLRAGGDQDRARRENDVTRSRAAIAVGLARAESRSARAQPKRSSSTSCGVRRSAKPMPSSSAFATSSWLSV